MSRHTTFGIGGPAEIYVEVFSRKELAELLGWATRNRFPFFLLGFGSNLLVRDGGIRGAVVRLRGDFEEIRILEAGQVEAGAGVRLPFLVQHCAQQGLGGIEPLVGVPGTVGGGVCMNAGTREAEIGSFVRWVEVLEPPDLQFHRLSASELKFGYRRSNLDSRILTAVGLQLLPAEKDVIMARIRQFLAQRSRTQPIHTRNIGSVFKNPRPPTASAHGEGPCEEALFAAKLIERSGLKGHRVGRVLVSERHANFIVNEGGGTAQEVLDLVDKIQRQVFEKFGVDLELEMKVVGEPCGLRDSGSSRGSSSGEGASRGA